MGFLFSNNQIEEAVDDVFAKVLSDKESCLRIFGPIYAYLITPSFLKKTEGIQLLYDHIKDDIVMLLMNINRHLNCIFSKNNIVHEEGQINDFADFILKECMFDEKLSCPQGETKVISKITGRLFKPLRGVSKAAFAALQAKAFRAATIEYFKNISEGTDIVKAKEMSRKKFQGTYSDTFKNLLYGIS